MITSDIVVLIALFAVLVVLARVERNLRALNIANKVALGLFIVFIGYYFFGPEIKRAIQESRAAPDMGRDHPLQLTAPDKTPVKTSAKDTKTATKSSSKKNTKQSATLTKTKKESGIKNKERQEIREYLEAKTSDLYEWYKEFKQEAHKKIAELFGNS